ncbi:MAG: nickel pincer cofactor biosynthesis protein LarC, partial [Coriobacteriia bacterium]|nr:nickel pincer cofactor biosynthesis protein LarC [Coriobacteriia bacterium]
VEARGAQPQRSWREVRAVLESAPLPSPVRDAASRAFGGLAEAEAGAHGVGIDEVRFHEVGAADSIVDVVGVCAGLHALGVERVTSSPVALGSGSVACAHGTLPVPAPATARLLAGIPVVAGEAGGELTTPTGAALLRALTAGFGPVPPMTLLAAGYGLGSREIAAPNVAVLLLGDAEEEPQPSEERVVLLETNVDHISAEHLAYAAERLRDAGALDVWQTPAAMKKGRLGAVLAALARSGEAAALAALLARETGTLGVRVGHVRRRVEARESRAVRTSLGEVRVKTAGGRVRPEHDDVAEIALRTGMPYDEAERLLSEEARRELSREGGGGTEREDGE